MISESHDGQHFCCNLQNVSFVLFSDFQNDGSNLDVMKRNLNKMLTQVPKRGNLDLKNVLDSVYFFS